MGSPIGKDKSDYLGTLLLASSQAVPPGKGEMRHGTEGWRCLETSFKVALPPCPKPYEHLSKHIQLPGFSVTCGFMCMLHFRNSAHFGVGETRNWWFEMKMALDCPQTA